MRTPSYVSRAPDESDKAYDAGYEAYSEGKSLSSYEYRQDCNFSMFPCRGALFSFVFREILLYIKP